MDNLWARVKALEGTTLKTLARGRPFQIVSVSPEHVEVIPLEGKGKKRRFLYDRIRQFAAASISTDDLRSRVQEEHPRSQHTSYIATVVRAVREPSTSRV